MTGERIARLRQQADQRNGLGPRERVDVDARFAQTQLPDRHPLSTKLGAFVGTIHVGEFYSI